MIHLIIGTKAQFIKMAPLIWELKKINIDYNLIDLGQHALITKGLRKEFQIDEPEFFLSKDKDIVCAKQALWWLIKIFYKSLSSSWIKQNLFRNQKGICLIHGDTASTIIGLYLAKRAGLKVAHIEAGLRSFSIKEPFPEEILRIITMKFSDILFSPSPRGYKNLTAMGLKNKSILIEGNTGQEAVRFSIHKKKETGLGLDDFSLVAFHRIENIFSKRRLLLIIGMIEQISRLMPIVFVQHQATISQLKRFRLLEKIKMIRNARFYKLLSHQHFITLLAKCRFAASDGGSIQEEAFYLGKPCLILRCYTERDEGIGENALLSKLDKERIGYFLSHYPEFNRPARLDANPPASRKIIEHLKMYA